MASSNNNLNKAQLNKNDEFYTLYEDIEKEMINHIDRLANKIVYCNCDDYSKSNFVKYFQDNFHKLKLKKLYASNVDIGDGAYLYEYNGTGTIIRPLIFGSYDSIELIEVLQESDFIITNPPFSLMRNYLDFITNNKKEFIIIASNQILTYRTPFRLYLKNKIYKGNYLDNFINNDSIKRIPCYWYSSFKYCKLKKLKCTVEYNENNYKKYDFIPVIYIDKIKNIPKDYYDYMGVPISIFDYDLKDFEVLDIISRGFWLNHFKIKKEPYMGGFYMVDGVAKFKRVLIKRKKGE